MMVFFAGCKHDNPDEVATNNNHDDTLSGIYKFYYFCKKIFCHEITSRNVASRAARCCGST